MTFCTTFETCIYMSDIRPVHWACIHMIQRTIYCRACIWAGGLSNDNHMENTPSHSQYSTLLWHLFLLPFPPPFPIPLSTWPANFMQFSTCPKHSTHSATTPSPFPHTHTVTERDCHLKANFLFLSYHLLRCNTGGSTAMWTISTSTNNTLGSHYAFKIQGSSISQKSGIQPPSTWKPLPRNYLCSIGTHSNNELQLYTGLLYVISHS